VGEETLLDQMPKVVCSRRFGGAMAKPFLYGLTISVLATGWFLIGSNVCMKPWANV
jgi:hypothetical protein